MADSETTQQVISQTPPVTAGITQQVTSKTPPAKVKDPKKVAAGKALQKKNREAREAQKKVLEAQQKELDEAKIRIEELAKTQSSDPPAEPTKITTTQWLSVISIIVSLVGLYYKREEIKSVFTKPPPSPVLPRAPPPSPVDAAPKRGIKMMN